jgi:hypothetical protein
MTRRTAKRYVAMRFTLPHQVCAFITLEPDEEFQPVKGENPVPALPNLNQPFVAPEEEEEEEGAGVGRFVVFPNK